jgi:hypothetical protein
MGYTVYRVYNEKIKKFQYFTIGQTMDPISVEAYNNAVLQGYTFDVGTGKKDINGNEIFTNDKVRDLGLCDNLGVVSQSKYNGFIVNYDDKIVSQDFNEFRCYERIGNIYEGKKSK